MARSEMVSMHPVENVADDGQRSRWILVRLGFTQPLYALARPRSRRPYLSRDPARDLSQRLQHSG